MNVLLMQSYFRCYDPKEWQRDMPYPPLGDLYLSSVLKKNNLTVSFFDGMLANSVDEGLEFIKSNSGSILLLYDDEFNYLTKMCLSNMRETSKSLIQLAKSKGLKVGVSSSDATDHSEFYLNAGADVVFVGEAEQSVLNWLQNLDEKSNWGSVNGIRFLKDELIYQTQSQKQIDNLDDLPEPDYDLIDIEKYRSIWKKKSGYFSLNVSTTRGCPFHCNWCAKPIYGQVYHNHSAERIAKLFSDLKQKYQVDHIWITDDIFGLKPGWLEAFQVELEKKNVKIPYKCLSRADLIVKGNTAAQLASTGCEIVWIGAESGSQKILDAMDKGTKVEQIYEATELLRTNKVKIAFFLQFGYSGENYADIFLTRKMVKDLIPDDIGISVSYPLPGTKFYERIKNKLGEKKNWQHSDDLEMMFDGTYTSHFYRQLYKVVHREYRLKKWINNILNGKIKLAESAKIIAGSLFLIYDRFKLNKMKTSSLRISINS